tara:strand:+ start:1940 stop:2905 length:966 start_codon:yes stop_codon:yes gene_type:complete
MALTSTKEYITHRNLKDIYPAVNEFSTKERIYNFDTTDTTNQYQSNGTGLITELYFDGIKGTSVTDSPNADFEFNYSTSTDSVQVFHSTKNPNDMIIEAGEDWSTLVTRMIRRASRMVESLLDSRMSREIMKDREGNYPEFIQRAVGLKVILMLMASKDPENPIIDSFTDEFNDIIEGYRSGTIQLPNAVTAESSKGVIREVSVNANSDLRPVELKGNYNGFGYELLKVKIETGAGGTIGQAKMTVFGKSDTTLKADVIVESEVIDGDFMFLVQGMEIRWSGDDVATAVCTEGDEYEIELKGYDCEVTTSQMGSVSLTRRF